jgi:MFS family permease
MGSSNLGDGLRLAAVPLLGALLTDSPALVAGLTAAMTAPWLLFSLFSGAIVDRTDRRTLMMVVSLARGLLVAGFALLVWLDLGTIALLYGVALVIGTGETLFDNAAQSVVPSIVEDPDDLERANGRLVSTEIAGNEALGPALGAALFAAGPVVPFAASGGLGLVASGLAARLRLRGGEHDTPAGGGADTVEEAVEGGEPPQALLASIREGLSFVWGNGPLRTATGVAVLLSLFDSAWFAILVLYATETLAAGELGFGAMLAAGGVGGVLGGAAAGKVSRRTTTGAAMAFAVGTCGTTQLVLGLATSVPVAVGAIALNSAGFALFNVVAVSLRQRLAPLAMIGRVNSVYRFAAMGVTALGAIAGGVVAEFFGIRAALLVGVPFLLGGALVVLRLPDSRRSPA